MNADLLHRIDSLFRECRDGDPLLHARAYVALDADIEIAITAAKARIFDPGQTWGDTERSIAGIHDSAERLATVGGLIAAQCERLPADDAQEALLRKVIVIGLANHGTAAKWSATVHGKPREGALGRNHALYRLSERLGTARAPEPLVREGVSRALTPEAHFMRAVLLPAVSGELNGPQLEILDSWLWTWVRDYRLTRESEAGEPSLWVDLRSDQGLRFAPYAPEGGDVRYLVMSRIREQLAEVIDGFHAGQIYPGFGQSTEMRIEAHVGLIDQLEAMWDRACMAVRPAVSARAGSARPKVDAFAGMTEILAQGFAGTRQAALKLGTGEIQPLPRRQVEVQEDSDDAVRLAVDNGLWDTVCQGDLVALRAEGDTFPSIGMVRRRYITRRSSGARLELTMLARAAQKVILRERGATGGGTPQIVPALYAPGADTCGRFDSLVVADSTFARNASYELSLEGRLYVIRFTRAKQRGRGWVAAKFEVEDASGAVPRTMH